MTRIVEKGFTLVETLVALAIAGVLVAIAVPSYKFYVARTQVTESLSSASMQSFSVAQNLKRGRCTTVAGVNDVYPNRFGTLTISGAKVTSKGENCPSGCTATFLFNDTTEKHLQGKQVVFNILNNQKVSFVSSTVDSLYLPKELKTISTTTTDNCTAIPDQPLTPTDGSTPGGSTTNPTPTTPTPTTPTTPTVPTTPIDPTTPVDPTNPTNPTDPTNPTNPTNPTDPTNPANGDEIISEKINTVSVSTNLINYNTGRAVFNVNHSTGSYVSITRYHRRDSSIKESITGVLNVDTPAEAKLAVVKLTVESGKSLEITLRHKAPYGNRTVFIYEAEHDFDCKSSSKCWNTLVKNENAKYKPISYIPTHMATDTFFNENVPHIVLPPSTPVPMTHRVPSVLEYKMYK
jgi:prepilin-type N-terminal cleavage/methylation domain-containing protein